MRSIFFGFAGAFFLIGACSSDAETSTGSALPTAPTTSAKDGGASASPTPTPTDAGTFTPSDARTDAGTDAAPAPWVTITTETVQVNGEARTYYLGTPTTLDPAKSYPVVVSFHGNPGTALEQLTQQPFDAVSHGDAILVYPQARNAAGDAPGAYNWDLFSATADTNADVPFVRALPAALQAKGLNVDTTRFYGYGYSGGAFFLQTYQCYGTDVFRSITCNAGGVPEVNGATTCQTCSGHVAPTLLIHGANDDVVGPSSGEDEAACQAKNAGCQATRTATTPAPCELYDGCPAGSPVELCFVPGVTHYPAWSESLPTAWAFFNAH